MWVTPSPWLALVLSIVAELIGTVALKYSVGLSKIFPSAITIASYCIAIGLMSIAAKALSISIVYSVWAAGSAVLVCFAGILLFQEALSFLKITGLLLSMAGIFLLKQGETL